ncbi:MAG: CBS domain-containing protein [Vicinamibacteria bacterium]
MEVALRAMDASFHVKLIGTFHPSLLCAPAEAPAQSWLRDNPSDFDQFPVKENGKVVGLLLRNLVSAGKSVKEVMSPIADGLVVSADMPIGELIPRLNLCDHRLIVRGDSIEGLVTQSDLLKLPVRLLLFALVTHLEQIMATLIGAWWPRDSWLSCLAVGRLAKVNEKEATLRGQGMNPPKIELLEFGDKRDLCRRRLDRERGRFKNDLEALGRLRDQLAHAATFIDNAHQAGGVSALVANFDAARYWIATLSQIELPNSGALLFQDVPQMEPLTERGV